MKKIIPLFLIMVLVLSGCSLPKPVTPISADEMQTFVNETYGQATLLDAEYLSEVHRFKFQDKEFEFEYYISSEVQSVGVAGLEGKQEFKRSTFQNEYNKALWSRIDFGYINSDIKVTLVENDDQIFGYITVLTEMEESVGMNLAFSIGTQLSEMDTRRFLEPYMLIVRDTDGNWLGRYDFTERKCITETSANKSIYMRFAQEIFDTEDILFEYSETYPRADVPGLSGELLTGTMGSDVNYITCYYFRYNHKHYFIADCLIMYNNANYYYIYNVTDGHSMTSRLYR